MNKVSIATIFSQFQNLQDNFDGQKLTSGHINQTFRIHNGQKRFILQKINPEVFPLREGMTENIKKIGAYLEQKKYPHKILQPLPFKNGDLLWKSIWRIFDFFENTRNFEKVQSADQAFEAALFLGEFHHYLADFKATKLYLSLPWFLDFQKRYDQFENALRSTSDALLKETKREVELIKNHRDVLGHWQELYPSLPIRVIHADPKISNFLWEKEFPNKIVGLIDWDTLMPGSILYDFGDMVRSYTNLKREDDALPGRYFSLEHYKALKKGFLVHLKDVLTDAEIQGLELAGKTVIYVQSLRFLTDYLTGNSYYATNYPLQNLNRTKNQLYLLEEIMEELP